MIGPSHADRLGKFIDANMGACQGEGQYTSHVFHQFGPCQCGQEVLTIAHGTYTPVNHWEGRMEVWNIRALAAQQSPLSAGGE